MGRFVNPDNPEVVLASQTTITDKNLYAYCDNNPVVRKDSGGVFWLTAIGIGFAAGIIGQYVGDVVGNVRRGETGLDIFAPTSSIQDYFASGVGGAIAAIPNLSLGGTMLAGSVGNVASDAIKGNIKSASDVLESAAWGAGANMVGYIAAKGVAYAKTLQIEDMTRAAQKNYLNTNVYHSIQANINMNYHSYMSNNRKGKMQIVESSLVGFKEGIYSTVTSTIAGFFR